MGIPKGIGHGTLWSGVMIIAAASAAIFAFGSPPGSNGRDPQKPSDLIVHEWGTFLGMNGSDGTALDGMYHEEHALPAFVHSRSRDQLRMPAIYVKGETPVIYFYTEFQQAVHVAVDFPKGIWTQWYPQANRVRPTLLEHAEQPDRGAGGRICWYTEVIPARALADKKHTIAAELPSTSSDALWNHAREVDAAFVKTANPATQPATDEYERFLFYRGLGEARLPLRFDEGEGGGLTLKCDSTLGDGVRHVFVLRVENGRGAYAYRPAIRPGERLDGVIPSLEKAQPLAEFTRTIADGLAARLEEAGLFAKEARAMVNTWSSSYFQTEGVRALFVLPESWTDAFIPLSIHPKPKNVVRVMVGRLELLTAKRERLAEDAVRNLASDDSEKREQAYRFLNEQGRYVEPIVRRVLKSTKDDQVRALCRRLLRTELVTELRAAIHNAADGQRLTVDPVMLRAQLARLLRDVGLAASARSEGNAVLGLLKAHPTEENQVQAASPAALEIRAAALEAIGDDRQAARVYARRIELRTRELPKEVNPGMIAELRDWWVSRAYIQCLARGGATGAAIAALGRSVEAASNVACDGSELRASRVLLALLLESQHKSELAQAQWSALVAEQKLNAAKKVVIPADQEAGGAGM
jgi:hypothetical protein